jgi:quercetin dioxygenase-like cupin family protein
MVDQRSTVEVSSRVRLAPDHLSGASLVTAFPLGDLEPIANRPNMRGRNLVGTEHGATSFFVAEILFGQDAAIPLHTHPTEEAFVVTEGILTMQLGEQTLEASAESTVVIPAHVPHAVRNTRAEAARALAAAGWNRATWFKEATTFLEGLPRE